MCIGFIFWSKDVKNVCFDRFSVSDGSSQSEVSSSEQSNITKNKASFKAPIVPFGMDLYYWGEEQPTAGKIIKYGLWEFFKCAFISVLLNYEWIVWMATREHYCMTTDFSSISIHLNCWKHWILIQDLHT